MTTSIGWMGLRYDHTNPTKLPHTTIAMVSDCLSKLCRYYGQCSKFYSVAQHSVLVSRLVDNPKLFGASRTTLCLAALLHDMAEVYVGDISAPQKYTDLYRIIREQERAFLSAMADQLLVPLCLLESAEVVVADKMACCIEIAKLFPRGEEYVFERFGVVPDFSHWTEPLPPEEARELFIDRYEELSCL